MTKAPHDTHDQQPEKADEKTEASGGLRFAERLEGLQQEVDAIKAKLEDANKKAESNWDKALRAVAELDNVKKRAEKDIASAHKYALEKFVNSILPVLDSMEKATEVDADHKAVKTMQHGVNLTQKMLLDVLSRFGVEQIDPTHEVFDPHLHEAMSMVEAKDCEPNTVITVYQKGYTLNGRLVRPARVVVAK